MFWNETKISKTREFACSSHNAMEVWIWLELGTLQEMCHFWQHFLSFIDLRISFKIILSTFQSFKCHFDISMSFQKWSAKYSKLTNLDRLLAIRVAESRLKSVFYRMLQDMNLKIGTYNPYSLSYDTIKAWNIDSASVSVMTKITVFLIMLKNCDIPYLHEFNDFYFSYIKGIQRAL